MTALQQDFVLAVFDRPRGSTITPKRLGYIKAAAEVAYRRGIDNNEWAKVKIPSVNFPSWVKQTHVFQVILDGDFTVSGAFEEYRIDRINRRGQFATIECRGLIDDLSTCGLVYTSNANDILYSFTDTKTVADWIAWIRTFHQSRGYTYWDVGTVTPAATVELEINRMTPQQILQTLASGAASIGTWEYRFEYDTAAGKYKLHFVSQYNSASPTLRVIGGQNIQDIEDDSRSTGFISAITPFGGSEASSSSSTPLRTTAQTLWKVTPTTGLKYSLADPGGNSAVKAIAFDDQFNHPSIGYTVVAQCVRTGRRYTVTDTIVATQEIELNDYQQLGAGDLIELLYVPAGTVLTKHYYRPHLYVNGATSCAIRVGTVTAGVRFAALDPNGGVNNIIHGRHSGMDGMKLMRSTVVTTQSATNYNSATKQITVASTAAMSAGQWGSLRRTTDSAWAYETFKIKTVVSATVIEIEQKYTHLIGVAFTIPNGALVTTDCIILAEQSDVYYVVKHTGYQNNGADPQQNIWTDTTTNLALGNYVEAYVEVGGLPITQLFNPGALTSYPEVASDYEFRNQDIEFLGQGGEPQMVQIVDAHFGSLSDAYGTSWTSAPSLVANTIAKGKHGVNSLSPAMPQKIDTGPTLTTDANRIFRAMRLLRDPWNGNGRLVFAVYLNPYSVNAGWYIDLEIFTLTEVRMGAFRINGQNGGWYTASFAFDPTVTDAVSGLQRPGSFLNQGFVIGFNGSNVLAYIDAIQVYWSPDGSTKTDDTFTKNGGGPRLWSRANEYLTVRSSPPHSIACSLADMYKFDKTRYAGKRVILGAPVSVYNEQTSTNLSARVTSVETSLLPRAVAKLNVELNTAEETLSARLASDL